MNYRKASIGIIGTGNIARNLGAALVESGYSLRNIYSRQPEKAVKLARKLHCTASSVKESIFFNDILFFCVPDNVLSEIGKSPAIPEGTVCIHTSGCLPLTVFSTSEAGVFWPLQTYSQGDNDTLKEFKKNPVFIEAKGEKAWEVLREIAASLSDTVVETDLQKRMLAHLAAVFACNFVNHMYAQSELLCKNEKIDFRLLLPLIEKTALRTKSQPPFQAQTGPAFRNDSVTIEHHLEILSAYPGLKELYTSVTNSIFAMYKKK